MAPTFSIHHDNRGRLGQAVDFNPDSDRNGLWIEGSDAAGGESGGLFMNGNVICMWSPGDSDLLRILDEDIITGTPVFTIQNGGTILHRGAQIHADYVFGPEYQLESIEEHTAYMTEEGHLSAIPRPEKDEKSGQDIIEYTSFMRGLLEELEKAHVYIARLNNALQEQRADFAKLSAQVETAAP